MTVCARGALGAEVERIQRALKEHDFYGGPVDGNFGRGTKLAVQAFPRAQGFGVDGVVGQATWGALFRTRQPPPAPTTAAGLLAERCFALTGAFETGSPPPECFCGLSGDFDGQGLSFGALQWCIGQDRADTAPLADVPSDISTLNWVEYERPDRELLERSGAPVRHVVLRSAA